VQTTSSYVTVANISSNSSDDDVQLDLQQFVNRIPMSSVGPVLVIADVSVDAAATQRYTVDVLFHHLSYDSASRCHLSFLLSLPSLWGR